jgi:hypothetical protein
VTGNIASDDITAGNAPVTIPTLPEPSTVVTPSNIPASQQSLIPVQASAQTPEQQTAQVPQSQQTTQIPEQQLQELQELVSNYLQNTGRALGNLDIVVSNFVYLITPEAKGGLEAFSFDDIKKILQDTNTPELETSLATYLNKDSLDLTNKDDVAKLANFASLIAVDKAYSLDELKTILADPNTKQLEAPLAAYLGKKTLDLDDKDDVAKLANFAALIAVDKLYTLGELKTTLLNANSQTIESIILHHYFEGKRLTELTPEEFKQFVRILKDEVESWKAVTEGIPLLSLVGRISRTEKTTGLFYTPAGVKGKFEYNVSDVTDEQEIIFALTQPLDLTSLEYLKFKLENGVPLKIKFTDTDGNEVEVNVEPGEGTIEIPLAGIREKLQLPLSSISIIITKSELEEQKIKLKVV